MRQAGRYSPRIHRHADTGHRRHQPGSFGAEAFDGPTVLVVHSRGGITTTAVANARPDLVDRIVYVSA